MKDVEFKIESPFEPSGDQPQAIKELCEGVEEGNRAGACGSDSGQLQAENRT